MVHTLWARAEVGEEVKISLILSDFSVVSASAQVWQTKDPSPPTAISLHALLPSTALLQGGGIPLTGEEGEAIKTVIAPAYLTWGFEFLGEINEYTGYAGVHCTETTQTNLLFLPAAKPAGHRTESVVLLVVVGEVTTFSGPSY